MKWHHSLYWRIAIGFVACLALLLMVQAMLFVWMMARPGRTVPNQPPDRLAQTIALDLAGAVERDGALDVAAYLRQEYASDVQPFFVLLVTGRNIEIGGPFEPQTIEEARRRLDGLKQLDPTRLGRGRGFGARGPFGPPPPVAGSQGESPTGPPPDWPGERGAPPPGMGGFRRDGPDGQAARGVRDFRPFRLAPIVATNRLLGAVVVPPQAPFTFLLARYAPVLGLVAFATLVVGAVLATLVVFGPARARLKEVEGAARRLGAGDLSARAPERGRDEVSAVATAFNAMAADLSARAEALREADRLRRQLLADVSHELNTPMTAIRGYVETLSMPSLPIDTDTRERYLRIIGDETGRLERIIGDLLDLARLEGGGSPLTIDRVPVSALFDRVVARHERQAALSHVRIECAIAGDAVAVSGDAGRLEQALQNLTANALRFAPSGSAVTLTSEAIEGGVALSVANTGPAIAPEHLPHLFDRFYRADSARARTDGASAGSGLGLSIVKAIVEHHGGTIAVTSTPEDTRFRLTLPDHPEVATTSQS